MMKNNKTSLMKLYFIDFYENDWRCKHDSYVKIASSLKAFLQHLLPPPQRLIKEGHISHVKSHFGGQGHRELQSSTWANVLLSLI